MKVDEYGTEAAALTAVVALGGGVPPAPVDFVVDRPFLILLREVPTQTILFFGVILDPS